MSVLSFSLHRWNCTRDQAASDPALDPQLTEEHRKGSRDISSHSLSSKSQIHSSLTEHLKSPVSMSLVELAEQTVMNKLCKYISTLPSAHKSFRDLFSPLSASLFLRNLCQSFCVKFLPLGYFQTARLPSARSPFAACYSVGVRFSKVTWDTVSSSLTFLAGK